MRAWVYDAGFGMLFNVVLEDGRRLEWQTGAKLDELIRREGLTPIDVREEDGPKTSEPAAQTGPDESGLSWLATT